MASKKQAKFFCENCGSEVGQNARFCNKCGRFFASVRCPVCGKTGSSNAFINGCPSCGYGAKGTGFEDSQPSRNAVDAMQKGKNHFYYHKKHGSDYAGKPRGSDSPLPVWIYLISLIVLAGVIAALIQLM